MNKFDGNWHFYFAWWPRWRRGAGPRCLYYPNQRRWITSQPFPLFGYYQYRFLDTSLGHRANDNSAQ